MTTPEEKARESVDAQHAAARRTVVEVERRRRVITQLKTFATANLTRTTRRVSHFQESRPEVLGSIIQSSSHLK